MLSAKPTLPNRSYFTARENLNLPAYFLSNERYHPRSIAKTCRHVGESKEIQSMASQSLLWRLSRQDIEDMTVCRFEGHDIEMDEDCIQSLRLQLSHLVEILGRRKLVLDFSNVTYLSSISRNMLILLHKRLRELNGWLILCNLENPLREVFEITRLDTVLDIRQDEPCELMAAG
jgi:anti-sigma B factor antagonist